MDLVAGYGYQMAQRIKQSRLDRTAVRCHSGSGLQPVIDHHQHSLNEENEDDERIESRSISS